MYRNKCNRLLALASTFLAFKFLFEFLFQSGNLMCKDFVQISLSPSTHSLSEFEQYFLHIFLFSKPSNIIRDEVKIRTTFASHDYNPLGVRKFVTGSLDGRTTHLAFELNESSH